MHFQCYSPVDGDGGDEREKTMAAIGNWGRWGTDDERGTLNLINDQTVLNATRTPSTGKLYQLALQIQREGMPTIPTRGAAQRYTLLNHTDRDVFDAIGAPAEISFAEDIVTFATHTGTHIDALCHVDHDSTVYNGHPSAGMTSYNGAHKSGIEKSGAFATRGVLVDVAGHQGVDKLPAEAITVEQFTATLEAQGTEIRSGDVVLIRTGWLEGYMAVGGPLEMEQPGIGLELARWLAAKDVAAIGADNSSVEVTPWDDDQFLGTHVELLVRHGIHMIEHVWLPEIAQDKCYEFLFIAAPLLITGATGSPLNPIAIG